MTREQVGRGMRKHFGESRLVRVAAVFPAGYCSGNCRDPPNLAYRVRQKFHGWTQSHSRGEPYVQRAASFRVLEEVQQQTQI